MQLDQLIRRKIGGANDDSLTAIEVDSKRKAFDTLIFKTKQLVCQQTN